MRTSKVRFSWNLASLLAFPFAVSPAIIRGNKRYSSVKGSESWRQQLRLEMVAVWGVKLGLLALDWQRAVAFIFIPHVVATSDRIRATHGAFARAFIIGSSVTAEL